MPLISESDNIRYLHFGSDLEQGAMDLASPHRLLYKYTRQMCAFLLFRELVHSDTVALLGLGNGSMIRFLRKYFGPRFLAVEWNPAVTECCHQYFPLDLQNRDRVFHEDAQAWVNAGQNEGTSDVLLVDLFDHAADGPVRDSFEFYEGCRRVLTPDGMAVFNLFGYLPGFSSSVDRIFQAFEGRVLMLDENDDGNQIVFAFNGEPRTYSGKALLERAAYLEKPLGLEGSDMLAELFGNVRPADQYRV